MNVDDILKFKVSKNTNSRKEFIELITKQYSSPIFQFKVKINFNKSKLKIEWID